MLPLLAAPAAAVLQLYLLHGRNHLPCLVVAVGLALKALVVEHAAASQEGRHPQPIDRAEGREDEEQHGVVGQQHTAEHGNGHGREEHREHMAGEKLLHAVVVGHALQQVACVLGVEEGHGKAEQLGEEVGQYAKVDPHADVRKQPAAHEVEGRGAEREHELARQHEPHKANVAQGYAPVYHGLGEQGQQQLYGAPYGQPCQHMGEGSLVAADIGHQEAHRAGVAATLAGGCLGEGRGGFQEHGYALVFAIGARAEPALLKLGGRIFHEALGRVGHTVAQPAPAPPDAVEHHKVALPPVEYAGQRGLGKHIHRQAPADGVQAQGLGGTAHAEQRDTLGRRRTQLLDLGRRHLAAVVFAHHLQAGYAALHGVVLHAKGENGH